MLLSSFRSSRLTTCTATLLSLASAGLLSSGCMSLTARKSSAVPLPNGVIEYRNPTFDNQINWMGWACIGAMTAGGGYQGYRSNLELRWTGWERRPEVRPGGNLVLGAMTGLASSLLITWITGGSAPEVTTDNAELWLDKLDDRMKLVTDDTTYPGLPLSSIRAVVRNADESYIIRSMEDAKFFLAAFRDSPHRDRVLGAYAATVDRDSLPRFATLVQGLPARHEAAERYIRESTMFQDAMAAAVHFPDYLSSIERHSAGLVRTMDELKRYDTVFSRSALTDSIAERLSSSLQRDAIPEFLESFPGVGNQEELKRRYVDSSATTSEAIEAAHRYPQFRSQAEHRAALLAGSVSDYRSYLTEFPGGTSTTEIREKLNERLQIPEPLGAAVNTQYSEICPVISPDGRTLYFSRKYSPENTGGSDDPDEIWFSNLDSNGQWTEARRIGRPLNHSGPDHMGSVTPDGNTLLLGITYDDTDGLSLTHRTASGWSYPERLAIEGYYNINDYLSYYLANDGKTLLLSIERYDGYGDRDVYVCFRQLDGSWSSPLNLGPTINTTTDDSSPFLAADGSTLYFSSDSHDGYGGKDVFFSRRLDDTWTKWSSPVNMGPTVNTDDDESYFFIPASGDYAYFSSSSFAAGRRNMDIVRIGVPESARPRPVALVTGRVLHRDSKEPLAARIIYESLADGKEIGEARSDPTTGEYKIALPSGQEYGFRAEAAGFVAVSDNINLINLAHYNEQQHDLFLVPIEIGQTIRINNLFFDFGKATIRNESLPELRRMSALMQANPGVRIEIAGHTDSIGTHHQNLKLSHSRADAVREYLVAQGIPAKRMSSTGYAGMKPVGPNDTEEGRQRNRRVEFTILGI